MFRRFARSTPSAGLALYVRHDCSLCDELEALIRAELPAAARKIRRIDVDSDPVLRARFGMQVPVLTVGGRVAFKARARRDQVVPRIERLTRIARERGDLEAKSG